MTVENYRGFERYTVDGLRRVNLLVGRNNSGKTSLIEAVQLGSSGKPLTVLQEIASRRREVSVEYDERRGMQELVEITHFFKGHRLSDNASFSVNFDQSSDQDFTATLTADDRDPEWDAAPYKLSISSAGTSPKRFPIDDRGVILKNHRRFVAGARREKAKPLILEPEGLSDRALAELYNEVVLRELEGELTQALQVLDQNVNGVFFLVSPLGSGHEFPQGVLIGIQGQGRLPLGSFGDGMRHLLGLAMALANSHSEVLLVDEIDTGLHYSVMADMWRLVIDTAKRFDVQVFATTHSLDCLRGLVEACERQPDLLPEVAVHKIDTRLDTAVTIDGQDLVYAVEHELELR